MEKSKVELKPGEIKFLEKFEKIHKEKPKTHKEAKEKVFLTIEKIKEGIKTLPEIKREEEFHRNVPISQATDILAQAIQITLNEGIEKGLKFIKKTNNPYLIDAFHDLLIGHFVNLIMKQ